MQINLNGQWECGTNRVYDTTVTVPGLARDPSKMNEGSLWYRRAVLLPAGDWTYATLLLKGARFSPSIYVNGKQAGKQQGGMTTITYLLSSQFVQPGKAVTFEIALQSLADLEPQDASRIPRADHWRSNISSCLWDDVTLNFHGDARLTRLIPFTDLANDQLSVGWQFERLTNSAQVSSLLLQVVNLDGQVLAETRVLQPDSNGKATIRLNGACTNWSPDQPACYRLKAILFTGEKVLDTDEMTIGLRDFTIKALQFYLNEKPVTVRSASVVWHRWLRDPEAKELAFDVDWFKRNIVQRLKSHGANGLRFHLGNPPEAFLDLCDQFGVIVQAEWHFFHGMEASKASLLEQWRHWLDLCMRHPSVCIIHPWNETYGEQLETAFSAIDELTSEYPPLVISHRDVTHIHKYWWSLFENVGLYYDSAAQFSQPIIVDEFGGNYLDGNGNPGGYPALKESFLRFLGRNHTAELRLQLNSEANTQVAEYWRRLGAAGFSPFCALSSPEDGNHHFVGQLVDGKPKDVWAGLTAAYAPISCSLEVWDRNFAPGRRATLPLYLFNDTDAYRELTVWVQVVREADPADVHVQQMITREVQAHGSIRTEVTLQLPDLEGEWRFQAILQNRIPSVLHPVISSWRFRTLQPKVPAELHELTIGLPSDETELQAFFTSNGVNTCSVTDKAARVVVMSSVSWERLSQDPKLKDSLQQAIEEGRSVAMLDVGPIALGQGYLDGNDLGPLQGAPSVPEPHIVEAELVNGVKLRFSELPEPESCMHPSETDSSLWENLPQQATWLWNGLRGGIIVPAYEMEPIGLSLDAFLSVWQSRGADPQLIPVGNYLAYELAGFYAFSVGENKQVSDQLREKVKFLVEDAPALQYAINPNAKVKTINLSSLYEQSKSGQAQSLQVLASAGKNLVRTPVVELTFGAGKGKLIVSQAISKGRLVKGYGEPGLYGLRQDPACAQFVLNLVKRAVL